MVVIW